MKPVIHSLQGWRKRIILLFGMRFYYYLKEYQQELPSVKSYEELLEIISVLVSQPIESLVLCKENNSALKESDISGLDNDSVLVVYSLGRVLCDGLNKEGVCLNPQCRYHNKKVVECCGFVSSARIYHGCTGTCSFCGSRFDVDGIYLKNCHFDMFSIRNGEQPKQTDQIDAKNLLPLYYDISSISPSEQYDFDVKSMDEYVCKKCFKHIENDHDCERVHRRSLCEDCVSIAKLRVCCMQLTLP